MKKRIVIPAVVLLGVLGTGGAVWASTGSTDEVGGGDRDRVGAAAVQAAGGGTVTEVETSDDPGEAYEVEIRKPDGTEVDVTLDKDLKEVADAPDAGDRALTDAERTSAEAAAVAAVSGGTVTGVEASDDQGVAYEVDVRDAAGAEWDLDLDAAFKVVTRTADN